MNYFCALCSTSFQQWCVITRASVITPSLSFFHRQPRKIFYCQGRTASTMVNVVQIFSSLLFLYALPQILFFFQSARFSFYRLQQAFLLTFASWTVKFTYMPVHWYEVQHIKLMTSTDNKIKIQNIYDVDDDDGDGKVENEKKLYILYCLRTVCYVKCSRPLKQHLIRQFFYFNFT